jgi:hypothetical protein
MHMFMMTIAIMIMAMHMPILWKTSLMDSLYYVSLISLYIYFFHANFVAYNISDI